MKLGVAEPAVEVASGKAYEYGWRTRVASLTLDGVEYFVDLHSVNYEKNVPLELMLLSCLFGK